MVDFTYNNSKNASTEHIPFELNYGFHLRISFEDKCNVQSRSSTANKLAIKLWKLVIVCRQNFLHVQDLQKQVNDKIIKP